jgi:hypothetical protein
MPINIRQLRQARLRIQQTFMDSYLSESGDVLMLNKYKDLKAAVDALNYIVENRMKEISLPNIVNIKEETDKVKHMFGQVKILNLTKIEVTPMSRPASNKFLGDFSLVKINKRNS